MAEVHKSAASLRIIGDGLVPEEITRMLGHPPTSVKRKGYISRREDGTERVAQTASWHLKASDRQPCDLDGQIREILGKLTSDLNIWRSVIGSCRVDLFSGIFLKDINEGFSVSPVTLLLLGSRGIELGIDVYGPDQEEKTPNQTVEPTAPSGRG